MYIYYREKCDLLLSKLIRITRGGKCEMSFGFCDNDTLQCSHNFSRRNLSIRWDEANVMLLCNNHHRAWEEWPETKRNEYLIERLGIEGYQDLLKKKNQLLQPRGDYLKNLSKELSLKLKNAKTRYNHY